MIDIQNLTKRFGRREALSNVTIRIPAGEVTTLLGANGAGKSTLMRCILGLVSFKGIVRVNGIDPWMNGKRVRAITGYMPQAGALHLDLTVEECLKFYGSLRRVVPQREEVEEMGLLQRLQDKVGDLSGGMRQRLAYIIATMSDPTLLLLDEPTAGLDRATQELLASRLQNLAAAGKTVLISTHSQHELLEITDRTVTLEEGKIVRIDLRPGVRKVEDLRGAQ